jgi:hypothetical protein
MNSIQATVLISYDVAYGSREYRGTFRGASVVEIQTTARQFASKYLHAVRITAISVEKTAHA